jgi:septum formation protein
MRSPPLILASQSPRRADLLGRLGLEFAVLPADIDETLLKGEVPAEHAERLAREKASLVASRNAGALVIGSDTIVVLGSDVLVKPVDPEEAVAMLRRLSGREHQVFTAVAIARDGSVRSGVERVAVRFRELSVEECREYVATREPLDKAGSYGIQGFGSALVESIAGDYFAVMGLPIVRTLSLLREMGWRYAFEDGLRPA